jgi:hypothetical protein
MQPTSAATLRSAFVQTRRLTMIELLSLLSLMFSPASCDPAARAFAQPSAADVTRVASVSDPAVADSADSFDAAISATGRVLSDDKAETQRSEAKRPELPRVFLDFQFPTVTGRTIEVEKGDNLQKALNKAQRGDEIVLAAGATFTGNFVLPAKGGTVANGWIVVRSEQLAQLPAAGTRVAAAQASLMPKIVTPNSDPALKTEPEASGWWLAGLEVTISPGLTSQNFGLITLGVGGRPQTTLASVPSDLVLDRLYIHAQPTTNTS